MKELNIDIFEQIGSNAAVSSADGDALYKLITQALDEKIKVCLNFSNIELITSTFLNAAIGQLYSKFDSPFLKLHLTVTNLEPEDMVLLKKVVVRAKEYFIDKEKFEQRVKEVLGDE